MMGNTANHQADIYSLGICLYVMITGQRPAGWKGDGIGLLTRKLNSLPELTDVPRPVQRLFEKMTAWETEQRYQSYDEILSDIAEIQVQLEGLGDNIRKTIEEIGGDPTRDIKPPKLPSVDQDEIATAVLEGSKTIVEKMDFAPTIAVNPDLTALDRTIVELEEPTFVHRPPSQV
jgi:serine/threonine protein kinase